MNRKDPKIAALKHLPRQLDTNVDDQRRKVTDIVYETVKFPYNVFGE